MNSTIKDTGIAIGASIPLLNLENWDGKSVDLKEINKYSVLIFISVYCSHCIDFLPEINSLKEIYDGDIMLFSNGNTNDHLDMVNYFKWDFPVFSIDSEEMEEDFGVVHLPFAILVNDQKAVVNKGVVYNKADFEFITKGAD